MSWEEGIVGEVAFWKRWLAKHGKHYQLNQPLRPYIADIIREEGWSHARVADVGSGALMLIGERMEGVELTMCPSDYLASAYNAMVQELGIATNHPITFQDMQHFSYPDGYFDFVHCCNALDHCKDPRRALLELMRICRPGGWVYLRHFPNEARAQRYNGLHQWNIGIEGDDCLFWNGQDKFRLRSYFPGFVSFMAMDGLCVSRCKRDA